MIQKLPKECFECDSVNYENYKLFIVDNVIVFSDNILSIEDYRFHLIDELTLFIYGKNVHTIGKCNFCKNENLKFARFPNLIEIKDDAFSDCYKLKQFIAPKC